MERAEPYRLATELARGTLHRARTLVAELESEQVAIPARVREQIQQAVATFIRAATLPATADDDALQTIRLACDVIAALCHDVLLAQVRLQRETDGPLSTLLVGRLGDHLIDEPHVEAISRARFTPPACRCAGEICSRPPNVSRISCSSTAGLV